MAGVPAQLWLAIKAKKIRQTEPFSKRRQRKVWESMSGTRKRLSISERALLAVILLFAVQTAHAVAINFNYDFDDLSFFDPGTQARTALEAAGAFFEDRINDDLGSIIPTGGNTWTPRFTNPSTGVVDTTSLTDLNLGNEILIIPGARDLPGGLLGTASSSVFGVCCGTNWQTQVFARGEGPFLSVIGSNAMEVAPWGGAVAVDSLTSRNFDLNAVPGGTQYDLFSVLLHEIGHILGIGLSGSWNAMINGSDEFTGAASVAEFGGNVPVSPDSDNNDHWRDNQVFSPVAPGSESYITTAGSTQEAAMDPIIAIGTRKLVTNVDLTALHDIGWDLTTIPLPGGFWMLMSGAALLLLRERSSRKAPEPAR